MNKVLSEKIVKLKKERNVLILAHNYQAVEIQRLADFCGDSLQLSIQASSSGADIILFCGVRFMAETAAILNPEARVLLPVWDAGCPMADMVTAEQLRELKKLHPGAVVVCYVNSSVEVKAESDICCTSSNAVKIVSSLPADQKIIFVPDQNLGSWVGKQTGREVILYNGYCPVHHFGFTAGQLEDLRKSHPGYTLLAHPECQGEIVDVADKVMSTSGMLKYAEDHDELIIATEEGLVQFLNYLYPEKKILALNSRAICQNMKKTHLSDLYDALIEDKYHIQVEPVIAERAVKCLKRMLELS
ncbi:MAG: quinolinate synthase NadA [Candidatus Cloacimonetes bacterium]|nr:quinolinate synthase NadA [Candidatus Cloacimonadota bacterium]